MSKGDSSFTAEEFRILRPTFFADKSATLGHGMNNDSVNHFACKQINVHSFYDFLSLFPSYTR